MNDRQDLDSCIDASLAEHVRVPRLDRRFDAAVWRRIEVEKGQSTSTRAAPARGGSAARWLRACNAAGVVVVAVLLGYFGLQLGGAAASDVLAGAVVELPASWLTAASWAVTACALAFGLRFTAIGKWLRAELF